MAEILDGACKQWIAAHFSPSVLVLTTAKVDQLCSKNGVDFADLIRPFGRVSGMNVAIPMGESTAFIRDFRIHVVRPHELQPRPADQLLAIAAERAIEKVDWSQWRGVRDAEEAVDFMRTSQTPWYDDFRNEYFRSHGPSDHEFFYHPVACLSVVEASAPEPIRSLEITPSRLPPFFQTSQEKADAVFKTMKETFGMEVCKILRINSQAFNSGSVAPPPDMWKSVLMRRWDCFLDEAVTAQHNAQQASTAAGQPSVSSGAPARMVPPTTPAAPMTRAVPPVGHASNTTTSNPYAEDTVYGRALSSDDVTHIVVFMRDFIINNILPFLRRKVEMLYNEVETNRKKFKFQLQSWWGGSKKPGKTGEGGSYPLHSEEMKVRRLADLLFFLQHWRLAKENYEAVANEFKSDRALKHFAGTEEMLGLSLFMMDAGKKDLELALDQGFSNYTNSGWKHLATRCTVFLTEIFRSRGMYREAAGALLRASSVETDDLRAALLIEQSAISFLTQPVAHYRKFAFHAVLAGHRFSNAKQRRHALRCYMLASTCYEQLGWGLIEDHINFTLGRLCAHLQELEAAVNYFVKLLGESQQPVSRQNTFLHEFLYLVKSLMGEHGKREFLDLPLPRVTTEDITVYLRDTPLDSNPEWEALKLLFETPAPVPFAIKQEQCCVVREEVFVDVEVWNPLQIPIECSDFKLEVTLIPNAAPLHRTFSAPTLTVPSHQSGNKSLPLGHRRITSIPNLPSAPDSQPDLEALDAESVTSTQDSPLVTDDSPSVADLPTPSVPILPESETSTRSEPIPEIRESLALAASDPQPMRTLEAVTPEPAPGMDSISEISGVVEASQPRVPPVSYEIQAVEVKLQPLERSKVRLSVKPLVEGTLYLKGVTYNLGNVAAGRKNFVMKGRRLNATKQQRMAVMYEQDTRCTIKVTSSMPLLSVQFQDFPTRAVDGEIRRIVVKISNKGYQALSAIRMRVSHPECFVISDTLPSEDTVPGWSSLSLPSESKQHRTYNAAEMLKIPCARLDPDQSYSFTLWFRAKRIGRQSFKFLFCYEGETPSKLLPVRYHRYQAVCEVVPSMQLTTFVRPMHNRSSEYLLGVQVSNLDEQQSFALKQLTAFSPMWGVEQLSFQPSDSATVPAEFNLAPFAATTLLFRLFPTTDPDIRSNAITLYGKSIPAFSEPVSSLYQLDKHYKAPALPLGVTLTQREQRDQMWAAILAPIHEKKDTKPVIPPPAVPQLDMVALFESGGSVGILSACNIIVASDVSTEKEMQLYTGSLGPLKFVVESPLRVSHNFMEPGLCEVKVRISLSNPLTTPVDFYIDTVLPHDTDILSLPDSNACQYFWAGTSRTSETILQPQETTTHTLSAIITSPGVFNMNRFRVSVGHVSMQDRQVFYLSVPHFTFVKAAKPM